MQTKLEDLKEQYIDHRLKLSEELSYFITIEKPSSILSKVNQIKELDEIITVLFK